MSYTVSALGVAALSIYARANGIDVRPELERLGLADVDLTEPDRRVEVAANDALWRFAADRSGDPDFGLRFAERLDLDGFHLVGHIAMSCPTLGAAIDRIVELSRLLHDAGRTEVERRDGGIRLFPGCRGLPVQPDRHIAEFSTASVVLLGRLITGDASLQPIEVGFQHSAPANLGYYRRLFGVEPRFAVLETHIDFSDEALALPVKTVGTTRVRTFLEAYARSLLAQLPAHAEDLRSRVLRAAVSDLTEGKGAISTVSARLGLSARTLQRRLAAEGTTFAEVVDEARHRWAIRYVEERVLPQAEIAYLLGFREPASFNRAFRRWTGMSPSAYRSRRRESNPDPATH